MEKTMYDMNANEVDLVNGAGWREYVREAGAKAARAFEDAVSALDDYLEGR
jgi:hypothetical protein